MSVFTRLVLISTFWALFLIGVWELGKRADRYREEHPPSLPVMQTVRILGADGKTESVSAYRSRISNTDIKGDDLVEMFPDEATNVCKLGRNLYTFEIGSRKFLIFFSRSYGKYWSSTMTEIKD